MADKLITDADITDTIPTTKNDLAIVVATPLANNGEKKNKRKKKRSGRFNFIKAVMLMFRAKPNEKSKPNAIQLEVASKGADNWKKIVGSMRPLTLQDNPSPTQTPSPSRPSLTVNTDHVDDVDQQFEDVNDNAAPVSPAFSISTESTSVYGSAMNLQELDNQKDSDDDDEEEEDEDQVFDNKPADDMIDAKAEEFIAHFYAQMRRQQFDSVYIL